VRHVGSEFKRYHSYEAGYCPTWRTEAILISTEGDSVWVWEEIFAVGSATSSFIKLADDIDFTLNTNRKKQPKFEVALLT